MVLNTDLEAAKNEIYNLDLLKVGQESIVLTERDAVLLAFVRLILSSLETANSNISESNIIDYVALADAIAGKTLQVSGDSVDEVALANAIKTALALPSTYSAALTSANITALADAIAAKTLQVSGDAVNESALADAIKNALNLPSIYAAALTTANISALVDAIAAKSFTLVDAATPANKLSIDSSGQLAIKNFPTPQAVTLATLPALAAGSNVIGGVTQSGNWNIKDITGAVALPTGASTETTLANLSAKLPAALENGRFPVDGSGVTQPVSLVSLPALAPGSSVIGSIANITGTISLPTGAATEATLTGLSGKLPSALVGDRLKVDGSGVTQPISGSVSISNSLTATGRVAVYQDGDPFYVGLLASGAKIGKVDVYYPPEGSTQYIDCRVSANTAANTFNDQNSWIDLSGVARLAFMLQIKSVPTPSTITGDVILEWSNDQTKAGVYESYKTYGTPSGGFVQATENIVFWTFALTPINAYPAGQILTVSKKARYFRPRMRLSGLSTTDATLQFQIQPIYF